MKIFDKAQWHIDAGEDANEVVSKIRKVFEFLDEKGMLTNEGKEMIDFGIDSSISLNERMVTEKGYKFLEKYYDNIIGLKADELTSKLENLYNNIS
ncbi:MAG: hypothetical protein MSA89_09805 [Clostridium sp.]|nr:hypothetical protein [Clostridium sp.]